MIESMVASFKNKRRERRGVAAVIGGVILIAILLSTVLTYFIVILDNDRARKSYEIAATDSAQEKGAEEYSVLQQENLVGTDMRVNITNDGSLPIVVSQVVLYCTSAACISSEPVINSTAETLNAKEETDRDVGPITLIDNLRYRVDVISDRGNIVSTEECTVDATAGTCESDGGDDEAVGMENIAQGTGSVQLDFKSFAVIFPDFTTRNGVDQTGRYVSASDVWGYPAYNLYGDVNTIIAQRLRNLDPNDDLRLTQNTAMITSFGGTKGNHPKPAFLCSSTDDSDPSTRTPIALPLTVYSNNILLERVPFPYDEADGWHNIYFCRAGDGSGQPTGAIGGWKPDIDYSFGINPIFMVMRAKIEGSQLDYAQTIPYQAFQLNGAADGASHAFVACSYATNIQTDCQQQTTAWDGSSPPYDYTVTAGTPFYIHLGVSHSGSATNQAYGATPYTVELIHPNGSSTTLKSGVSWNDATNRNIEVTIPAGTAPEYYAIKVTDSSDIAGTAHQTVFMTVQVIS
jgi:hypothetical protein